MGSRQRKPWQGETKKTRKPIKPPKTDVKTKANASEAAQCKKAGGLKHPNSGACGLKGDWSKDNFMVDSKQSMSNTIVVSATDFGKLCDQASCQDKDPLLLLELGLAPRHVPSQWACIPFDKFIEIMGWGEDGTS